MKRYTLYIYIMLVAVWSAAVPVVAQEQADKYQTWGPTSASGWGVLVRAGYVLGGTSPLPLPKEVRSINRFRPEGGMTFGADAYKMFNRRWGLTGGLHFFLEGMNTGADVKNYHMGITQGEDYLEGNFTGTDVTKTFMAGFTLPVTVTFRISPRWNVNVGPYLSALVYSDFEGSVYNGYLREGNPTGQKVEIGSDNPATYDFSDDMRTLLWGVRLGFDWKAFRHTTLFAGVDWGLNGVFHSDFKTVDFPMYPLYAHFGVAYRY